MRGGLAFVAFFFVVIEVWDLLTPPSPMLKKSAFTWFALSFYCYLIMFLM